MSIEMQSVRRGWLMGGALLCSLAFGLSCTGGGETVISGIGNSGNRIGLAARWEALAVHLAKQEAVPPVTDAEIESLFEVIRKNALEGNVEAALVLLALAEEQREVDD